MNKASITYWSKKVQDLIQKKGIMKLMGWNYVIQYKKDEITS